MARNTSLRCGRGQRRRPPARDGRRVEIARRMKAQVGAAIKGKRDGLVIATKFAMIVPRSSKSEDLKLRGNGTGPFMQERFTPNGPVRILKRNPNYWRRGLSYLDSIEFRVIEDSETAAGALESGDIDIFSTSTAPLLTSSRSGRGSTTVA